MPRDQTYPPLIAALVRHYDELVEHLRRRFGADRGFARDVVHDVCVNLLAEPPRQPVLTPIAYLRRATLNLAIDRHRVERARAAWVLSMDELPDGVSEAPGQARRLDAAREFERLAAAIETLPPRCREVFVLHKVHELPQAEVALTLGISRKAVEKHVRLGLAACRAALQRELGS
ncbi:RNA polymerase subunit sigma-70 [Cupriavidus sp. USMAA2-4]|uniref:RNA polymerase sigma factor n=1 Tax=Cupriavidus sp. USMAA2-4 TaxID=876364 RepID=UPI0008A6B30C|nr:RNA polymerase sigma factor [Cupriavidus sp. USMAA2-4]AOY96085.1 RNA polymerase subunit sigma-70 [Cupriavidus sp. USMAA2-4]